MPKYECTLRLLEPSIGCTRADTASVELSGQQWAIAEYDQLSAAPAYTCISYAWGENRAVNILDQAHLMSARTVAALGATIDVSQSRETWASNVQFSSDRDAHKEDIALAAALRASHALWIDALCVPPQDPARTACLKNMGEIFSSAWQVFVVLSKSCSGIFHNIRSTGRLDPEALFVIEKEDWITRAWTYQEAVNSRALYFVVEDDATTLVSGLDFLNAVMKAIGEFKESQEMDALTWTKHHPLLDRLEALLADYRVADYATRSAYQVMSVMDQRIAERPEDHFYAMVGAITTTRLSIDDDEPLHPSEYLMRVCEEKGDYSFIYSVAPRSEVRGRRWRPLEGTFTAVLSGLTVFGSGQAGLHESTHLQLDNMCRLLPGAITSDGLKAAKWFMGNNDGELSPDGIASGVLERLTALGFTGCGEYLELENGFFFPQSMFAQRNDIFVIISRDVHWVTGGPGLLLRSNGTDINDYCDVGAFVGRVPKCGESIRVG